MDIRVNTTTNRPYTGVCVCVYRVAFIRLQHCSTAWCHVYKYYSIYYHSSSSILCIVRRLAMLKVRCISTDYIGTVCSVPPRRLLFCTVRRPARLCLYSIRSVPPGAVDHRTPLICTYIHHRTARLPPCTCIQC